MYLLCIITGVAVVIQLSDGQHLDRDNFTGAVRLRHGHCQPCCNSAVNGAAVIVLRDGCDTVRRCRFAYGVALLRIARDVHHTTVTIFALVVGIVSDFMTAVRSNRIITVVDALRQFDGDGLAIRDADRLIYSGVTVFGDDVHASDVGAGVVAGGADNAKAYLFVVLVGDNCINDNLRGAIVIVKYNVTSCGGCRLILI